MKQLPNTQDTAGAQSLIAKCGTETTETEFYEAIFSHLRRIYSYMADYDLADAGTYEEIERKQIAQKLSGSTGFHAALKAVCAQKGVPKDAVAAYIGQGYEGLLQADFYIADRIFKYLKEKNSEHDTDNKSKI